MSDLQVEATGETVGEAKWAALRELEKVQPGLDKSAVRFQELSEGERGLLGVGYAPARVVATVPDDVAGTEPREESALAGEVRWGPWRIASELPGLKVRTWRPGDRLAGRSKKIQDVFVDAKIPRSEREAWPLVVRGDEVVAVPGIVEAEGIEATRE